MDDSWITAIIIYTYVLYAVALLMFIAVVIPYILEPKLREFPENLLFYAMTAGIFLTIGWFVLALYTSHALYHTPGENVVNLTSSLEELTPCYSTLCCTFFFLKTLSNETFTLYESMLGFNLLMIIKKPFWKGQKFMKYYHTFVGIAVLPLTVMFLMGFATGEFDSVCPSHRLFLYDTIFLGTVCIFMVGLFFYITAMAALKKIDPAIRAYLKIYVLYVGVLVVSQWYGIAFYGLLEIFNSEDFRIGMQLLVFVLNGNTLILICLIRLTNSPLLSFYRRTVFKLKERRQPKKYVVERLITTDQKETVHFYNANQLIFLSAKIRTTKIQVISIAMAIAEGHNPGNPSDRLEVSRATVWEKLGLDFKYNFKYQVKYYYPKFFESLRNEDFQNKDIVLESFDLEKNKLQIEKAGESLGSSGSFMMFTFDKKFVIKTIPKRDKDALLSIAEDYYRYASANPRSFLNRIYGIFKIKQILSDSFYVILLENINFGVSHLQTEAMYDLKGSTFNRHTKRSDNNVGVVWKDGDFLDAGEQLELDHVDRRYLWKYLQKDINFMTRHGLIDYSLLVTISGREGVSTMSPSLPSRPNPIRRWFYKKHTTQTIYSFGVIDFLQRYTYQKRLERYGKQAMHLNPTLDTSSMDTKGYATRFLSFVREKVLGIVDDDEIVSNPKKSQEKIINRVDTSENDIETEEAENVESDASDDLCVQAQKFKLSA